MEERGPADEVPIVSNAPQCSGQNDKGASGGGEDTLEHSDELMEKGSKASKDRDYAEAIDCFSRALEIRVARYGELSPECVNAFYKYGCALLYKAQDEADPLGAMPKKDVKSLEASDKDESGKNFVGGEASGKDESGKNVGGGGTSVASASNTDVQEQNSNHDACNGQDEADEGEESDNEDQDEGDEDDSDLDLAWKMLDLARAIAEKDPSDTMQKVDILSALGEVALEREDIETSLSDYHKALAILERIAEPDSRYIAELNFRICICFEISCKPSEAIPYCEKAISICKSRMQRLSEEVKSTPEATSEKEAEIETLSSLMGELEKKLEDLQQLEMNPTSMLSDILNLLAAKASNGNKVSAASAEASSSAKSEAPMPSFSTASANGTSGVTDLGVVGRGVKRVTPTSCDVESESAKKPALEPSNN